MHKWSISGPDLVFAGLVELVYIWTITAALQRQQMGQFTVTHTAVSGGGRAGVSFKLHFTLFLSNVRITNVLDVWKAKGPS